MVENGVNEVDDDEEQQQQQKKYRPREPKATYGPDST